DLKVRPEDESRPAVFDLSLNGRDLLIPSGRTHNHVLASLNAGGDIVENTVRGGEIDHDIHAAQALFRESSSSVVLRFQQDLHLMPALARHLTHQRPRLANSQQKDFHAFE